MSRPIINNPKGINRVIETITKGIAVQLPVFTENYGQAVTVINTNKKRLPAIPVKDSYIEMFPDNQKDNLIFAIAHDPLNILYQAGPQITYSQEISIICWMNQSIFGFNDYLHSDEIIDIVTKAIGVIPGLKVKLQKVFKEPQNVYEGFDYDIIKSQFLMYPYTGFRLLYLTAFAEC